jgi:transposase-like protein
MKHLKTLQEAIIQHCREFMVAVRWLDGVARCPYCDATKLTWLANAKLYRCYGEHPKQKFSLKVGTVFEDSPIGLEKWLPAVWLLANSRNGVSSHELARSLGVTQRTAWFMLHRIRMAMQTNSFVKAGGSGSAPLEVDETWVGGEPKNRHKAKRDRGVPKYLKTPTGCVVKNPAYKSLSGRGSDKTIVFGMLDRETRQVRAQVIPKIKREILMNAILEGAEPGSTIYSDGLRDYQPLSKNGFIHETVNHVSEYVRGDVHTNGIENFWSCLKRGLKGTYVAVEPFHLTRYIDEQVFRFNNRATKDNPLTDLDRFTLAVSQIVGKRLTYAELTGKVGGAGAF